MSQQPGFIRSPCQKLQLAAEAQIGNDVMDLAAAWTRLGIGDAIAAIRGIEPRSIEPVDAAAADIAPIFLLDESSHSHAKAQFPFKRM